MRAGEWVGGVGDDVGRKGCDVAREWREARSGGGSVFLDKKNLMSFRLY